MQRKRPELWRSGDWFLHHDNAPAHTALSVTWYLASLGWTTVPHPSYSPDLAPCDFFLFLTMKKTLKEKRFATVEEVKTASQETTTLSFSSSRDASHSGKTDWTSVLPPMESILKGIKFFSVWNVNKTSFLKKIRFFGSPLVHVKDAYRNHSADINTVVLGCVHNTNHRYANLYNMQHGQTLNSTQQDSLELQWWNVQAVQHCDRPEQYPTSFTKPCQQNNHGV